MTDLVVVLPGIMGSTLRHEGKLVWAPSAGMALRAIKTFGASIKVLELPEGIGDDHPQDGVEPVALMPDLHVLPGLWTPVKGYDRLLARLRSLGYTEAAGTLLPVPYDWRLSNRYNGARLASLVEPALERLRDPDAQLVFVCHSMGGLVARWYIEHCGGAGHTRKLITLGTPYRGAAKALEQLVNGVQRGIGPLSVDLTTFGRSLPSLHQLLPEYACIEVAGSELAKTTEAALPDLRTRDVEDAMRFHTQLNEAERARPDSLAATHAIVGTKQPTTTTAIITDGRVIVRETYRGDALFGDSTVPAVGACRPDVPLDSNMLRRVPDKHGNLQRNQAALDELEGILTAKPVVIRAADTVELRLAAPELLLAGEPLPITIATIDDQPAALLLTIRDESGAPFEARVLTARTGAVETVVDGLPPGAYSIDVDGQDPAFPMAPVSADLLVWA